MAVSLLLVCLTSHAVSAVEPDSPDVAIPSINFAASAPTGGRPVSQAQEQEKEKDVKNGKDAKNVKEKEAPTVVYPRKDRAGNANPYIGGRKGDEDVDFVVRTELPGMQRLYRRESEIQMFERIRQEANRPGTSKVYFPEEIVLSRENYQPRGFPHTVAVAEPAYVVHGRLYFEQLNMDRYGWTMGVLDPVVSVSGYYYDLVMLPYHHWSNPNDKYETSAGKCLPGDPTPLLLYPEPFSVTGLAGMFGTYVGGVFFFR